MTLANKLLTGSAALALAGLLACGGGGGGSSTPPPAPPAPAATALTYTDPTSGTYKLVKNAASTPTHLVLDLVGPATGTAQGVSLSLNADTTKVTWVDVAAGGTTATLVSNVAFNLGADPKILKARATGNVLQATVAQKNPTAPLALTGSALVRVALDLKPGLPQGTVAFSAHATQCQVLADAASAPTTITVAVGTLNAQ